MRRIDALGLFGISVLALATVAHGGVDEGTAAPAGAGAGWLAQVRANLERAEYDFAPRPDGALSAPNRANGFRTQVTPDGIEVSSRDPNANGTGIGWRMALSVARWGRPGRLEALQPGSLRHESARIAIDRGDLTEIYVNDAAGLEQILDVPVPPSADRDAGPLVIEMELAGDLLGSSDPEGAAVLFRDPAGKPIGRLSELRVVDSGRREVPARFRLSPGRLAIEIDDRDAVYPLHVDPLLASPSWQVESNQAGAFYGLVVSTAGDVNGDGFSDVLIGAYSYDNGQADEGRVYLYLGSASGLSTSAARTFESNQMSARFGWALSTAGDLNGDGFDDFAVGAQTYDNGQTDEGAVFVYTGAASAASIVLAKTLEADQADARLGYSLAYAGDVDGDGDDDLVAGAPNWDGGASNEGAMFVYSGDPATVIAAGAPFRAESNQADAALGIAVAGGVDVNADGFDDVFGGASGWDTATLTSAGRVLGFYGSATGLPAAPSWTEDGAGGSFGSHLAAVGDTNGDGYADLAIGAPGYSTSTTITGDGRLYLYRGSSTGVAAAAAQTRSGGVTGAQLGSSVAPAGDVNGDGFADVAVGANGADPGGLANAGEVRVWYGAPSGIPTSPSWVYAGTQANSGVGEATFTAGDVNGDGYSDLIVGSGGFDNPSVDEGRAYVFLGSGDGPVTTPSMTLKTGDGNSQDFGYTVASAGDVNADGFGDVIVGDPHWGPTDHGAAYVFLGTAAGPATSPTTSLLGLEPHAAFGYAVGCARDVNGDGYDDVIVGEPYADIEPDDENGKVYVFYGGPSGVDTTADFQAEGTDEFDQNLGKSVAGPGDVNGDGFADILVGGGISHSSRLFYGSPTGIDDNSLSYVGGTDVEAAGDLNGDGLADVITHYNPAFDSGAGYVYYGASPRLGNSESWSRSGQFGATVHAAGDVDGDGYADVVAETSGPSGSVRELYLGGPSGLGAVGDQALSFSPFNARTVGDVNGDGFADLMNYPTSSTMEIRFGSATGYGTTAGWTVTVPTPTLNFGDTFAPAGDVNGDGFVDVVVGAPDDAPGGSAIIYFGGGGDGLDFIPRNYRGDNTGPVAFLGNSGATDRFRILSRGRSARGRAWIAMDHQVAALGTSIAAGTFVHGNYFDTGTTDSAGADVNFGRLVSGLLPWTHYTWRMRFSTEDPIFPRTRWIALAGNGPNEVDVKTMCTTSSWYRDVDGDGYGAYPYSYTVCIQPVGYVAASGDCADGNPAIFPGQVESCDGIDNDCDLAIDDGFIAPGTRPVMNGGTKLATTVRFDWPAVPGADRYDARRGDLLALRVSGDFTAANNACIDDAATPSVEFALALPPGAGEWFLARAGSCQANTTYDDPASKQVGSRDAELNAVCP